MKQIIKNYSFSHSSRTVTLADFSSVSIERLLLITNVTTGVILYQFNSAALGATASGNVITLTTDTSAMQDSDKLQIIYNSASGDPVYDAAGTTLQGNVASGTADAGNPVKTGGIYSAGAPIYADGQRVDAHYDINGNQLTNLATKIAGEDLTSDVMKTQRRVASSVISASAQIRPSAAYLCGLFVSSASATPTIKVWDSTTAAGNVLIDTFTPATGTYYNLPDVVANTGIYVTISGTVSCAVFTAT
jgi:hypothetical protein